MFSFCLIFCKFQLGLTYESVAYVKKNAVFVFVLYRAKETKQTLNLLMNLLLNIQALVEL